MGQIIVLTGRKAREYTESKADDKLRLETLKGLARQAEKFAEELQCAAIRLNTLSRPTVRERNL